MNNATIFTADRTTHVKIVAVSLIASIAVLAAGIASRNSSTADTTARIQTAGPALKVGKPIVITHSETTAIR
jgi:hypothetical protein